MDGCPCARPPRPAPTAARRVAARSHRAPCSRPRRPRSARPRPRGPPTSTPAASRPERLLPAPFRLEQRLDVDLDKDGDLDAALVGVDGPVPAPETMDGSDSEGERILLVARRDRDGWRTAGTGRSALMCRRCGGRLLGRGRRADRAVGVTQRPRGRADAGSRELTDWTHATASSAAGAAHRCRHRPHRRLGPSVVTQSTKNLLTGCHHHRGGGDPRRTGQAGHGEGQAPHGVAGGRRAVGPAGRAQRSAAAPLAQPSRRACRRPCAGCRPRGRGRAPSTPARAPTAAIR